VERENRSKGWAIPRYTRDFYHFYNSKKLRANETGSKRILPTQHLIDHKSICDALRRAHYCIQQVPWRFQGPYSAPSPISQLENIDFDNITLPLHSQTKIKTLCEFGVIIEKPIK
jgi:hypothetical protein